MHQEEEFAIAGYTAPTGLRPHFGALLLERIPTVNYSTSEKSEPAYGDSLAKLLPRMFQLLLSEPGPPSPRPRRGKMSLI